MNRNTLIVPVALALLALAGCANDKAGHNDHAQHQMQLPPGWSEADMKACMEAGMPGKNHEWLAQSVGTWNGKTKMWMAPDAPPMDSECVCKITSIMDGRYIKSEMKGDMPGMGEFHGVGVSGFDNVSQQFVGSWIDNHSSGIMQGVGRLSPDGKVMTWDYTYNCPITKRPAVLRQVDTYTGPNTMTMEMFGTDPKSGREFKMMQMDMRR